MSKMDNLRAMREARYEQAAARAKATTPSETTPRTPPKAPPAQPAEAGAPASAAEPEGALCGHRNMSGRTCTREAGHAARSHRYS